MSQENSRDEEPQAQSYMKTFSATDTSNIPSFETVLPIVLAAIERCHHIWENQGITLLGEIFISYMSKSVVTASLRFYGDDTAQTDVPALEEILPVLTPVIEQCQQIWQSDQQETTSLLIGSFWVIAQDFLRS